MTGDWIRRMHVLVVAFYQRVHESEERSYIFARVVIKHQHRRVSRINLKNIDDLVLN